MYFRSGLSDRNWNIRIPGPKKVLNIKFELDTITRTGDIKHGARRTVHGAKCTEQNARCKMHGAKCTEQAPKCLWKITEIFIFSETTRPILMKFGTRMY